MCRQDDANLQWRDTFLVERGKIPHTKIHLAKPRLPSKQEKVVEVCKITLSFYFIKKLDTVYFSLGAKL